jgi:nitrile hydratase
MLLTAEIVPGLVAQGASARAHVDVPPKFKVGDKVRARNLNPTSHTRLPGYVRGREGVIEFDYGVFEFPDTHARVFEGVPEKPQHCYRVRFTAREVWGPTAHPVDTLRVDLFDDYLDPA